MNKILLQPRPILKHGLSHSIWKNINEIIRYGSYRRSPFSISHSFSYEVFETRTLSWDFDWSSAIDDIHSSHTIMPGNRLIPRLFHIIRKRNGLNESFIHLRTILDRDWQEEWFFERVKVTLVVLSVTGNSIDAKSLVIRCDWGGSRLPYFNALLWSYLHWLPLFRALLLGPWLQFMLYNFTTLPALAHRSDAIFP